MADRSTIDEIKERLDIAEVVREYVELKRSGQNEFGLCPFHQEKTSSFSVNSTLGIYKCFGCGEAGDVISFLQKIEGLEFHEALKMAANRAGVTIKDDRRFVDDKEVRQKQKVLEANELAAKFFHWVLLKHNLGEKGLKYLKDRGIRESSIRNFNLGYAPQSWSALRSFLNKKGYSDEFLLEIGLLASKNDRVYDKFRDRIIFPLVSEKNEIVGFAGRILDSNTKAPKYLNSPETSIFKKSNFLYGLSTAKQEIRKQGFCILVEGPTDVISSTQSGISNICAPQGTSLTIQQLKLLSRYCDTIYFCFDQDDAGQNALIKGIQIAQQQGLAVKVIGLEKVKDADELIKKDPKKWEEEVGNAQEVVDYFLTRAVKKYNLSTAEGKVRAAEEVIPFIALLQNDIEINHKVSELASFLEVDPEVLEKQIDSYKQKKTVTPSELRKTIQKGSLEFDSHLREDYLLSLLLQCDSLSWKEFKDLTEMLFEDELDREIFNLIKRKRIARVINAGENEPLVAKISTLMLKNIGSGVEDEEWVREEIKRVMKELKKSYNKRELARLQIELSSAEKSGNEKKVTQLLDLINKLYQNNN